MDVVLAEVAQVDGIDVRRVLDVLGHARRCHDVVEGFGYLEDAGASRHAARLQRRRNGQANRLACAFGVGYDEVRRHGVEPTLDAFHRCVERLQVYAQVLSAHLRAQSLLPMWNPNMQRPRTAANCRGRNPLHLRRNAAKWESRVWSRRNVEKGQTLFHIVRLRGQKGVSPLPRRTRLYTSAGARIAVGRGYAAGMA